jgi:hypothetical protein
LRGKLWLIAPSEPVDDLEGGKERAAAHAQEYREFGTAVSALEGIAIRVVSIGSVGQLQHASARSLKITPYRIVNDDGASGREGLDGMEYITRHDRD